MVAVSDLFTLSLVALFAQINHADAVLPRPVVSASTNLKHRLLHFLHLDRRSQGAHHVTERFSFARWVDNDKFANPDTAALSPEQAWQAYLLDSAADKDNDASPHATRPEEKRWDSQVTCRDKNRGKADEAVACIGNLLDSTRKQELPCHTTPLKLAGNKGKGEKVTIQFWCRVNDTIIAPSITAGTDLGEDETRLPTCESVAQTVGVILDTCTRESDHTVSGWREKDLTGLKVGVSVMTAQTFMIEG